MSKQIILTALVDNLGAEGDTVTVADGYARNYLIPKGLAMPATAANLRRVESLRKKREASLAAQLEGAKTTATQLVKQSYTITAAAGEDGKLYGSVTASDISEALKKEGVEVDRRKIALEHPIRELGVFDVDVKLHPEVATKVKIWVVGPEGEGAPAAKSSAADEKAGKKAQKADKKK
ncbi:MAG TPA: 50S ribosomal protein L9 [Verrucomicrobiae bacterium]|nr:50S ribosomal protein L9 [Verrucomicrobiae bacterium]